MKCSDQELAVLGGVVVVCGVSAGCLLAQHLHQLLRVTGAHQLES